MVEYDKEPDARNRIIKVAFGIMALVCLTTGLILYLRPDFVGLDPETAKFVAIAFLFAGLCDYLLLRFWDKLVRRR
ncbi:MAG: hypothetical protein MPJ78_06040 [Hyphomicrobiaceae bacterium]|nr:hypothetical protein [Hyphomicrobiaceae bacterium]